MAPVGGGNVIGAQGERQSLTNSPIESGIRRRKHGPGGGSPTFSECGVVNNLEPLPVDLPTSV